MPDVVLDAYAHVGLPRFLSVADYRGVMASGGIVRAVLCAFDSCPDLAEIHAALMQWPETFRGIGVPLGADRAEMEAGVRAQLTAGFSGLRLTDADVLERPFLLDLLGRAGAVPIICGRPLPEAGVRTLLAHLERYDEAVVIGGHFAGVREPAKLRAGALAELFGHPRFHVVFSRQGGFPAPALKAWTEAVLARTGWKRVMWGSEAPVLFWRNETVADALAWIDQFAPGPAERARFFGENVFRVHFTRPIRPAPLALGFDPWARARPVPAGLFANGVAVEQALAGRLVHAWRAAGGKDTLGAYLATILDGLPR
jgi:hypothetical protein